MAPMMVVILKVFDRVFFIAFQPPVAESLRMRRPLFRETTGALRSG